MARPLGKILEVNEETNDEVNSYAPLFIVLDIWSFLLQLQYHKFHPFKLLIKFITIFLSYLS